MPAQYIIPIPTTDCHTGGLQQKCHQKKHHESKSPFLPAPGPSSLLILGSNRAIQGPIKP